MDDYYKDGISLDVFLEILEAMYYRRRVDEIEFIRKNEKKKWELPYFKKNLWSLGFLDGDPNSSRSGISPRGKSLLCIRIFANKNLVSKKTEKNMSRFILLKAIADIDWSCFMHFLVERWIKNKRLKEIRNQSYRYDTEHNFEHRWGFHRKILEQISLPLLVQKLYKDEFINNLEKVNPYSDVFDANLFFNKKFYEPTLKQFEKTVLDSINIYQDIFKEDRPFAYSEVLKTIIQVNLFNENFYVNEAKLSHMIIKQASEFKIHLYRSSRDIRIVGRGFYNFKDWMYYYPYFEII